MCNNVVFYVKTLIDINKVNVQIGFLQLPGSRIIHGKISDSH